MEAQEKKGASTISPAIAKCTEQGCRDTENYAYPKSEGTALHADRGGLHLGTAISISGAAASPNMGFHTSPPLAFLMTVFDVRMGWWLPNSRYENKDFPLKRSKP